MSDSAKKIVALLALDFGSGNSYVTSREERKLCERLKRLLTDFNDGAIVDWESDDGVDFNDKTVREFRIRVR